MIGRGDLAVEVEGHFDFLHRFADGVVRFVGLNTAFRVGCDALRVGLGTFAKRSNKKYV